MFEPCRQLFGAAVAAHEHRAICRQAPDARDGEIARPAVSRSSGASAFWAIPQTGVRNLPLHRGHRAASRPPRWATASASTIAPRPLASPICRTPSARPSLKSMHARAARLRPSSKPKRVRGSGRRYRMTQRSASSSAVSPSGEAARRTACANPRRRPRACR